jgi:hypothetical protein
MLPVTRSMASRTYQLFAEAMAARRPVVCMYDGYPCAICPIILGHSKGAEKALIFQFDGLGSKGPVRGDWRCLELDKVSHAELIDGPWHPGQRHSQAQKCVGGVDLDVTRTAHTIRSGGSRRSR